MRDPNANCELFRRDQSNSDGIFTLSNVAPVHTRSLRSTTDGPSTGPAPVLARYLPHSLKINVAASQRNITVPEPIAVQTH